MAAWIPHQLPPKGGGNHYSEKHWYYDNLIASWSTSITTPTKYDRASLGERINTLRDGRIDRQMDGWTDG